MALGADEVKAISRLARLAVSEDQAVVDGYARELSSILALAAQMQAVDTDGITPLAHPLEMSQRLRADLAVADPSQRERLQNGAPRIENGLYLVPKVID